MTMIKGAYTTYTPDSRMDAKLWSSARTTITDGSWSRRVPRVKQEHMQARSGRPEVQSNHQLGRNGMQHRHGRSALRWCVAGEHKYPSSMAAHCIQIKSSQATQPQKPK